MELVHGPLIKSPIITICRYMSNNWCGSKTLALPVIGWPIDHLHSPSGAVVLRRYTRRLVGCFLEKLYAAMGVPWLSRKWAIDTASKPRYAGADSAAWANAHGLQSGGDRPSQARKELSMHKQRFASALLALMCIMAGGSSSPASPDPFARL